jgi:hypothetical protein
METKGEGQSHAKRTRGCLLYRDQNGFVSSQPMLDVPEPSSVIVRNDAVTDITELFLKTNIAAHKKLVATFTSSLGAAHMETSLTSLVSECSSTIRSVEGCIGAIKNSSLIESSDVDKIFRAVIQYCNGADNLSALMATMSSNTAVAEVARSIDVDISTVSALFCPNGMVARYVLTGTTSQPNMYLSEMSSLKSEICMHAENWRLSLALEDFIKSNDLLRDVASSDLNILASTTLSQQQRNMPNEFSQSFKDSWYEKQVADDIQRWRRTTNLPVSEQFLGMNYRFTLGRKLRKKQVKKLRAACKVANVKYPTVLNFRGRELLNTDDKGQKIYLERGNQTIENILASTAEEKAWARDSLMFAGTGQKYKSSLFWNFAFNLSTKTLVREVLSNQLLEIRQRYQEEYQ